jgi:hypothetical protein
MTLVTWEAIGAVGEMVGAFGVVLSLLYLATQIRLSRKQSQLEATRTLVEAVNSFTDGLAQFPELTDVYLRGLQDFASLSSEERVRFSSLVGRLMRTYEQMLQHDSGKTLHSGIWSSTERSLIDIFGYPGMQDWWETRKHWYGATFQEHVATRLAQSGSVASGRMYGEQGGSQSEVV